MFGPSVWFSWAMSERPGWSQFEPTAGNGVVAPEAACVGALVVQASWV